MSEPTAWAFGYSAALPTGLLHEGLVHAWSRQHPLPHIRWEMRRIFPAVGYIQKSNGTKLCLAIKDQGNDWKDEFEAVGMDIAKEFGDSEHAKSKCMIGVPIGDDHYLEQEYWLTTLGLMVLM